MQPDFINACFQLAAAAFTLNHCRVLYKEKKVAGVSILSVSFFVCWGVFNLYYYPSLNQPLSFIAGVVILLANLIWVGCLIYYRFVLPKSVFFD